MEMERGFQEINQYDDSMFPVGIYVVTKESIIPRGRGFRDFHWHEELQITLALEGDLTIRVHTRDYELKEGEGIFINRNLLHAVTCMSEHGKYASLNFPEKLLSFFPGVVWNRRMFCLTREEMLLRQWPWKEIFHGRRSF